MASTANEYLWLVRESAFGTQVASPVVGTSQFLVPLPESNAFNTTADNAIQEIKYGGGLDIVRERVSGRQDVKSTLTTYAWPALTAFLASAAVTRINAGQTTPWTTTEPPNDLVSLHGWRLIRDRAGTWHTQEFAGGKIGSLTLAASSGDPRYKLNVDITWSKVTPNGRDASTAGTPPAAPTEAQYPTGCYKFSDTTVTASGGTLSTFEDVSLKITNMLDVRFWANPFAALVAALGRTATVDFSVLLKSSPGLRDQYEGMDSNPLSVTLSNGTNSILFDYHAVNQLSKVTYDLGLGKVAMQKATYVNLWDPAANTGAGGDVDVTAA